MSNCIVSIGVGGWYADGIKRLDRSLIHHGWSGGMELHTHYPKGCPTHQDETGRQIQMARLLGREIPARFVHHPLIKREDGAKLSKSNRDTGIRDLRASGLSADQVLGRASAALGLGDGHPLDEAEIVARIRASVG